ncbi:clumping factor A-like [Drosophila madeirensis]|uniref:Clumping factor A-like n=1 Tax=Drosophila madeirensis TaxID=30013 RepID=A0AAU9FW56_DROMD
MRPLLMWQQQEGNQQNMALLQQELQALPSGSESDSESISNSSSKSSNSCSDDSSDLAGHTTPTAALMPAPTLTIVGLRPTKLRELSYM